MFLYLTLYMQNVLGYSPLEAGLRFLPLTVLSLLRRRRSPGALLEPVPARGAASAPGSPRSALGLLLMHGDSRPASEWTTLLGRASWSPASGSG